VCLPLNRVSIVFGRCREKQRKESSRLQTVNRKLSAMNKLLMEENDRLQKQVSRLVFDNGYMKNRLHSVSSFSLFNCTLPRSERNTVAAERCIVICERNQPAGLKKSDQRAAILWKPRRDSNQVMFLVPFFLAYVK